MIKKMECFVSSLTDQEIDCQLKDIFEWARVYKELLETEQAHRQSGQHFNNITSPIDTTDTTDYNFEEAEDCDYVEFSTNDFEEKSVDFELAQMIQRKVSTFSEEKTREQLEKLKQIPTHTLSLEDLAQLRYEIETCELHLFELTGGPTDGNNVCPSCGAELEVNAKFCGRCGAAI